MKHDTKSLVVGMLAATGIVVLAAFAAASAHADGPSQKDYSILHTMKQNQASIAKDRAAYEDFITHKNDNEIEFSELTDGWTIDWSTMTLIPATPSFQ